jgi:nucleoside-diphosphate-sugar epimerase
MDNKRSILLTGASGFIGSHILDKLQSKCNLFILESSRSNNVKLTSDIRVVSLDGIESIDNISDIIHCAGAIKGGKRHLYEVNVLLTKNLLLKNKLRKARFIYISSINTQTRLHSEYDKTKKEAEDLILSCDYSTVIIRPSYVFSSDEEPNIKPIDYFFNFFGFFGFFPILHYNSRLQPLEVNELAEFVFDLVFFEEKYHASIFEIAGPKKISVWDMLMSYTRSKGYNIKPFLLPRFIGIFLNMASNRKLEIFFQDKVLSPENKNDVESITCNISQPFLKKY